MIATRLFLMLCGLLIASAIGAADSTPSPTPTPTVEAAASAASTAKRIAYIEIDGEIDPAMSRYYRRAMDEAVKAKVDAVVVHLTTPGGRVDSAEEMVKAAYHLAILGAARETGMDRSVFPSTCPWSYDQMIDPNVWPEAA